MPIVRASVASTPCGLLLWLLLLDARPPVLKARLPERLRGATEVDGIVVAIVVARATAVDDADDDDRSDRLGSSTPLSSSLSLSCTTVAVAALPERREWVEAVLARPFDRPVALEGAVAATRGGVVAPRAGCGNAYDHRPIDVSSAALFVRSLSPP